MASVRSISATVAERIAHVINRFAAAQTPGYTTGGGRAAVMTLLRPPSMSMEVYIRRLIDYMYCSPECFVIAAIYTMRMVTSGAVHLNQHTTHRVFGACLVLAIKTRDDLFYRLSYYAQVLGVPVTDLNMMELFVLRALDFRTHVEPEDYALMVEAMVEVDACGDNAWTAHLVVIPRSSDLVSNLSISQNSSLS